MRFAPHTALPRAKGMHQPRDSAVLSSKQTATVTAGGWRASTEQVAQTVEGGEGGGQQFVCFPPPTPPACIASELAWPRGSSDAPPSQVVLMRSGVMPACWATAAPSWSWK